MIDIFGSPYDKESFITYIKEFLPDFELDERPVEDIGLLKNITQIGKSKECELSVFEIRVNDADSGKRITITQNAFRMLRRHRIRNALIAFHYHSDDWRLSLLTSSLEIKDGKIVSKSSNPRRYSYLLGSNAKVNTPRKFLLSRGAVANIRELQERFSVEVVNREFYNSISACFMELVGGERGKGDKKQLYEPQMSIMGASKKELQEFAVRLIGRIMFCWFLKEKKSGSGRTLMPNEFLSLDAVSQNSDYYHNILEPLFFGCLNTKMTNRKEDLREVPFNQIPYLNGGLFNPQKTDNYTQNDVNGRGTPGVVKIPDKWFTELFNVLNQYNFTVDENTSFDIDLSIDPEMLGRIFENLLAEINPETGETARKNTGSFYTPREIVDYMVDNSLYYYLKGKTGISSQKLRAIISYGKEDDEEYPLDKSEKQMIINALDELTILDPACGSGAFPIGVLQKVVYILQQIDENGKMWFEKQIQNIPSIEMQNDLKEKYANENYDYIRKLGVIRRSIFGVDIQTIATEIAKLRCFLTLIIEEEANDDKPNRGIHPLPNLDFKFVTADSLVDLQNSGQHSNPQQLTLLENKEQIEALKRISDAYFTATPEQRNKLETKFVKLQLEMFSNRTYNLKGNVTEKYDRLMSWKPFDNTSTNWFSSEWMFGVEKFDIVISNPPYVHFEKIKEEAKIKYEPLNFETYNKRGDIYTLFIERGVNLLKDGGILTYITSNKWMRASYGEKLRNYLVENTNPLLLVDLGGGVFESATVDTDIIITKKEPYRSATKSVAADENLNSKNIESFAKESAVDIKFNKDSSWIILSPIEQKIKEKIERFGTPLKDWDIKINRGVLTGLNDAFIINEETRQQILNNCKTADERERTAKIIRPILRGRDIKKNGYEWPGLYLICTHNGYELTNNEYIPPVDIEDYQSLKEWFDKGKWNKKSSTESNYNRLSKRTDKGRTPYNLRDCAYMDDFDEQKIMWSGVSAHFNYVTVGSEYVINAPANFLTGNNLEYLKAFLNSSLMEWYYRSYATQLGENGIRFYIYDFMKLRIPPFTDKRWSMIKEAHNPEIAISSIYSLTEEEMKVISDSVSL